MSDFDEYVAKYEAQGCTYHEALQKAKRYEYNRGRYLEQQKVRDAIRQLEIDDPIKYAKLVYDAEHAGEAAARVREGERRQYEERRRLDELRYFKFDHSLVVVSVPTIEFSGVEGMIAFRTWNIRQCHNALRGEVELFLGSTAANSVWTPQMIADKVPTENNTSGLYCVKLDPLGLMTRAADYFGSVCGLLELRGKVLEHSDGIVRAEWARIICVFVQVGKETECTYGGLHLSYPTVPMYVLHREQIAEVLLRVTMIQSMRKGL